MKTSSKQRHIRHQSKNENVEDAETNLINFSFVDCKAHLNRVLLGFSNKDRIIEDQTDFWIFLNKYETLLKRIGQPVLPNEFHYEEQTSNFVPKEYNKLYATNFKLKVPFEELYSRLSNPAAISEKQLRQFLQIVIHYLDFKQKEKFTKLQKLRKVQANLPVAQYRTEIVEAVKREQVVIIAGDTGCGKSTQVPQYLYQGGFQSIACTQPRRIACISLAKRVSHEMLCEYGTKVGYQIRFEQNKSKSTNILFITEGLLLRQIATEAILSQYDVLVLDEVHERHLHGDFLLGIAKCLLKSNETLKIVLMSATINLQLFVNYFSSERACVIEVPGRLYPIKLHYMPIVADNSGESSSSKNEKLSPEPYMKIMQLIDSKYPIIDKGDLLIFMSGLNEITTIVEAAQVYNEKQKTWIILPLHSSLSIADQDKVFDYAPDGMRKCIVSTNLAETSVTIDGIRFVVDSGKMKEMSYDPGCKMSRLKEFWISKASADQRKGRAGRTGPGICYRIYSEKHYSTLEAYAAAEVHRVPLESLLLQMIAMGLPNARLFPFIEPPPKESIENAILSLKQHDALTIEEKLSPIGLALSKLPVDISIGKMLLMGCVFKQLQPVLTLAAALSVQTPFTNRAYRDSECERARKPLESDHGDPITSMNVYKEWLEIKQGNLERKGYENTKQWCRRRGLEEQRFYEITKLRNQFQDLLSDCGLIKTQTNTGATSAERAIRHGEMRQLKTLKRAHKFEAPQRRKLLKSDTWQIEDGEDDQTAKNIDIRDVEFRLSYDARKIQNLVSGATACSYRDLMTLKLILVSGLYPQIAIPDEFNYLKTSNQNLFHTQSKPFTSLHPMSYFGNNSEILHLSESDIIPKPPFYDSRLPLSARHQLLVYLNLLETNKPYLMNTLRMPAAQTLLLFAHTLDTNTTFSRIVCDSWLCLDFPFPGLGQTLLLKSSKLRNSWNQLLEEKLSSATETIENSETKKRDLNKMMEEKEYMLWQTLSAFMATEVMYTIKRLLPADMKSLYVGNSETTLTMAVSPNPFNSDFVVTSNPLKGGVYLTENITFGCIVETGWSLQLAADVFKTNSNAIYVRVL